MTAAATPLLLDTHVWVWLAFGTPGMFRPDTRKRLEAADPAHPLHVSIISTWEVAQLAARGRLNLSRPTKAWVAQALAHPSLALLTLDDLAVVVESNELPGDFHADPADRLLVATARIGGYTLVTSDRQILDYGKAGYVNVLAA
ncbi:MAG: Ribonuclease VapC22 [Steroidobacteraceae bacterium]|nr:Ribonuclease VapC22 [Steroidobacteraceae bacterium]